MKAPKPSGEAGLIPPALRSRQQEAPAPSAAVAVIGHMRAWAADLEGEIVIEEFQPRRDLLQRRKDTLDGAIALLSPSSPSSGGGKEHKGKSTKS